jgi:two-component system, OmpR family, phosphate regulon sensor histidine kinase PhoR
MNQSTETALTEARLDKLADLIERERKAVLAQWRQQVCQLPTAQGLDAPALDDHIPALLDELADAFRRVSMETIPDVVLHGSPPIHGRQRLQDGFDIVEVVAEYNILRGGIHDLAERNNVSLRGQAFHILNRVFDEAIGVAVQTFATQQALEVQRRREEYLAFVAHDLRTPLNAISLAAQALTRGLVGADTNSETARMLKTLHRNGRRLEELVDHVLKESDHVGTDAGIKVVAREFDLWPLVETVVRDLQPVAETAGTRLNNSVPDDLSVYGDAALVRRVLQNLIANAINFTPRGEVTIEARASEDGGVECWVRDNGAGIPTSRLETIFDKGETESQEEGATGLGLPIVKAFVEAHGGTVAVDSKEGNGSTFRFTLPGRAIETTRAAP